MNLYATELPVWLAECLVLAILGTKTYGAWCHYPQKGLTELIFCYNFDLFLFLTESQTFPFTGRSMELLSLSFLYCRLECHLEWNWL